MMKFVNLDVLTEDHINVLNEKMTEGQGIREILRRELGAKSVTKKVRDEVNKLNEKLQNAGYILEEGVYKMKQQEVEIIDESKEESKQKSETKNKKTYMTKKQKAEMEEQKRKELEEQLKENPFLLISRWDLLEEVDRVACDISSGKVKPIGVYTNCYVDEAFKELQDRFYYIPSYLLINASVRFAERNLDSFINSKWVEEFTKIYQNDKRDRKIKNDSLKDLKEEKKEISKKLNEISKNEELNNELKERLKKINSELRRKQTNVKMSTHIADVSMFFLKEKFPFLSQSDIVLMCVYSFSKCFINELNK